MELFAAAGAALVLPLLAGASVLLAVLLVVTAGAAVLLAVEVEGAGVAVATGAAVPLLAAAEAAPAVDAAAAAPRPKDCRDDCGSRCLSRRFHGLRGRRGTSYQGGDWVRQQARSVGAEFW